LDFRGLFELEIVSILLYVDDMAIMVDDEGELEQCIQVFKVVTHRWGLTINVNKTKLWKGDWRVANGGVVVWKCHDTHPHYYLGGSNWGSPGF